MLDFDAAWKELQAIRRRPDNSLQWSKRAPRYDSTDAKNLYAEEFLRRADVRDGESVFDMGCGTGMLAVVLAEQGHDVIAADFSEGMLGKFAENMAHRGIADESIRRILMSWEDDWTAFGLQPDMVDVAFASRSISVADLRDALTKLTRIARRRACITMTTGVSPRVDPAVLHACDIPVAASRDYLYAFGLLAQAGFEPTVSYIRSERKDTFPSVESAREDFFAMIDSGAPELSGSELEAAQERMSAWLDEHLIDNPDAGKPDKKGLPQGKLTLDMTRIVSWAFIAWDTKKGAF